MRKAKAPKQSEPVRLTGEIEGWDWSFSFLLNKRTGKRKYSEEPYYDFRHLHVKCKSAGSHARFATFELVLLPNSNYNEEPRRQHQDPGGVGGAHTKSASHVEAIVSMPTDVLNSLLIGLSGKHLRFASLTMEAMKHRRARVLGFGLQTSRDPDDE